LYYILITVSIQVRINCVGDAADFGVGNSGETISCFDHIYYYDDSKCNTSEAPLIDVKIKYRVQNAMQNDDMKLSWANFEFGGQPVYPTDGDGNRPYSNPRDYHESIDTQDIEFPQTQSVWYSFMTTVDPCGTEESRTAWMQMKLQPISDSEGFWTNKCGTQDTIRFAPGVNAGNHAGPNPTFPPNSEPNFDVFDGPTNFDGPNPGPSTSKGSKPPSTPKSKAPSASKSPTVGKGKGEASGAPSSGGGSRRTNRVRRATSRRTPVRA